MALRTDYKDDILDLTQNTQRKYKMITNSDGTVSFTDVTTYSQVGDSFGAAQLNEIAKFVNEGSPNIYYDPSTDMIQIKGADGIWHDWASGGLLALDVTDIATSDWSVGGDREASFSASNGVITWSPTKKNSGQLLTSYMETKNAYKLSSYNTLELYGNVDLDYNNTNSGRNLQISAVLDGKETVLYTKSLVGQTFTIDETITLPDLNTGDYNIRISLVNWWDNSTHTVSLSKFKFLA